MANSFADMEIEVSVADLLEKLHTNRAKHLAEYEKAKVGYEKLLRRELETKLRVLDNRAKGISSVKTKGVTAEKNMTMIVNQKPTNYLGSYDQVIGMLEFTLDVTIRIDARQYEQYIKNEWSWTNSFTTSNVAYSAAAR